MPQDRGFDNGRRTVVKALAGLGLAYGASAALGADVRPAYAAPAVQTGEVNGFPRAIQAFPVTQERNAMPKRELGEAEQGVWFIRLTDKTQFNAENGWKGSENFSVARLLHPETQNIDYNDFYVGDKQEKAAGVFRYRLMHGVTDGIVINGMQFVEQYNDKDKGLVQVGDSYRVVEQEVGPAVKDTTKPVAGHIKVQQGDPGTWVALYDLDNGQLVDTKRASRDGDIGIELPIGKPVALAVRVHNAMNEARFQGQIWNGTIDRFRFGETTNQFPQYRGNQGKGNV